MNDPVRGVVVGWDGSRGAQLALDWAAEAAKRQGLTLTVIHCVDLSMSPGLSAYSPGGSYVPSLEDLEADVLAAGVARAERILDRAQIVGYHTVGTPAGELVSASEEARLVVTGSRGRGRLLAGLLGSTSYAVTAHARCPAVVVPARSGGEDLVTPPQPGPGRRVVVGVDGSEPAGRALEAAAQVAHETGGALHLVGVGRVVSMESVAYVEESTAGTEHTHALREEQEHVIATAAERIRAQHPDVTIETDVLFGEPGHALADLGANAGMIVLGSRGHGGFTGLLLGSVSHTVIHEAACPVMVVP